MSWSPTDPDRFRRQVERWREAGATHLGIDTMYQGLTGTADHLAALESAAKILGL